MHVVTPCFPSPQRDPAPAPDAPPLSAIMRVMVCIWARMEVYTAISSATWRSSRPDPLATRRLGCGWWGKGSVGAHALVEGVPMLRCPTRSVPQLAARPGEGRRAGVETSIPELSRASG